MTLIEYTKNATVVKARAIYGKRLKENDYRELSNRKTVSEVAEYLKKYTHYSGSLNTIDISSVHRGHLESIIRRHIFEKYIALCDFQQLRSERFYNYLVTQYEIKEILNVILHINSESNDEYISSLPSYLISKTKYDLIALARASDIEELKSVIKNTPYYNIINNIGQNSDGRIDYIRFERELRTYYFNWLIDVVRNDFSGEAEKMLSNQIKMQIELINVINLYRMKKYYNIPVSEMEKNIFSFRHKLKLYQQKELLEAENIKAFLHIFSKTYYGKQMKVEEDDDFETRISSQRGIVAKKALMFSKNAAVSIYSLLYLFELEVSNLIKIIECIRYDKTPEYIQGRIISV